MKNGVVFNADLNPPQLEAVTHGEGPLLVLAGAGSGKTRVITYRIAHLLKNLHVPPGALLAVTFTNKAAGEMRERIERLVGKETAKQLWIGTFHALCLRILKRELPEPFSIYDDEESKRLLKECLRELNLDNQTVKLEQAAFRIESAKHELVDAAEFSRLALDFASRQIAKVYDLYQRKLARNRAVDFGDLILRTVQLFNENPEKLAVYREKIQYLLVDEYQDINHAQYRWIRLLTGDRGNLTVVGDDDQSIYQFRGADLRNILEFERDFPSARVIKLEQNYRSTQNILAAAGAVVANNRGRKDKTLWTENPAGETLTYFRGQDEADEAAFVVRTFVEETYRRGRKLSELAVLYRTNAQSRPLEDALRRERMPYRLIGGMRFYDRMEIKDALAYLKVLVNPADELSLERIINLPPRGLGEGTLAKLRTAAFERKLTLLETMAQDNLETLGLGERALAAVRAFVRLQREMQARRDQQPLPQLLADLLRESGYLAMWEKAEAENGMMRLENLNELVVAAEEFCRAGEGTLEGFLDQIALVSSLDEEDDNDEQVTLMTLHSAKGLEFPVVCLVGMEEGLFPHSNALQEASGLEEERRLCYVGLTRARERLVLTGAATRSSFGNRIYNSESRFLHEIPARLFMGHKPLAHLKAEQTQASRGLWRNQPEAESGEITREPLADAEAETDAFPSLIIGQRVRHARYGPGTIVGKHGDGQDAKLEVAFTHYGRKKLMARFAALQPVGAAPGGGQRSSS
ncbi:MAG: UvrD-helicase domain-containing protein [candidate division FCPU426 bacterium]